MMWARRHKILAALLPALVLAVAIGITVSAVSAGHTVGRAAAPELAATTSGAKWLTGPPGRLLNVVNADLGRLGAGDRAGKRGAAKVAAVRLAADAAAALSGPMPPGEVKIYRSALKGFERASMYISRGKFSKAGIQLNAADSKITKVTSAVNHPAEAGSPAAVNEPNGQ
jgi:hypothetical protein